MNKRSTKDVTTPAEDIVETATPPLDESASAIPFNPVFNRRQQRILDHRVEAQEEDDTMIAGLAGVNSDLMDFQLILSETLRQSLAVDGGSLETIERHEALFDLVLRFTKQISQISQLERRFRKGTAQESTALKPR